MKNIKMITFMLLELVGINKRLNIVLFQPKEWLWIIKIFTSWFSNWKHYWY